MLRVRVRVSHLLRVRVRVSHLPVSHLLGA